MVADAGVDGVMAEGCWVEEVVTGARVVGVVVARGMWVVAVGIGGR